MILGNLLNQASTIIPTQQGTWLRWTGRARNSTGVDVDTYAPGKPICGSFQSVPQEVLRRMGLEYKKSYYMLFTSEDVGGLNRDRAGDRILWQGRTLKAQTKGGWRPIDGWGGVLLVEVPPGE